MIIIYIDIILLSILLLLVLCTCGYCVYRVHWLQRTGQVAILLRPTKVLFTHRKEGESTEQLRTVVAYQNPFTGDYCVHKSRVGPKGYVNAAQSPDSTDSGMSDAYEPLNLVPPVPPTLQEQTQDLVVPNDVKTPLTPLCDNRVNKSWRWNYTEYQI